MQYHADFLPQTSSPEADYGNVTLTTSTSDAPASVISMTLSITPPAYVGVETTPPPSTPGELWSAYSWVNAARVFLNGNVILNPVYNKAHDPLSIDIGEIDPSITYEFRIEVDLEWVAESWYNNHIRYSVPAGTLTVTTGLIYVTPLIIINSPDNNERIKRGTLVQISASVASGILVDHLHFKIDGGNLGTEITESPYEYMLDTTSLSPGTHTISVEVLTQSYNTITASVIIIISSAQIQIINPLNNQYLVGNTQVAVTTQVSGFSEIDPPVVAFTLDVNTTIGSVKTSPYALTWDILPTLANGQHTITAKAKNTTNEIATDSITVNTTNQEIGIRIINFKHNDTTTVINTTSPVSIKLFVTNEDKILDIMLEFSKIGGESTYYLNIPMNGKTFSAGELSSITSGDYYLIATARGKPGSFVGNTPTVLDIVKVKVITSGYMPSPILRLPAVVTGFSGVLN